VAAWLGIGDRSDVRIPRVLLLWFVLGMPLWAGAQAIPVQDLSVLVDAAGTETIATASAPAVRDRYAALSRSLHAGYTHETHWLRFTVQAPAAGEWWLEVQPSVLDDLRLFEPVGAGFAERRAGDRLPWSAREEDYRAFVFKLALPDTAPRTFYLRVQTTSTSMAVLRLWSPARFRAATNAEYAGLGLLLGALALMWVLALTHWVWLWDELYGWFSLYIFSSILLRLSGNGLVGQYLLPEYPRVADLFTGVSLLFSMAAAAPFYRRMLRVQPDHRFWWVLFRAQALVPCALMVLLLVGYAVEATRIGTLFTVGTMLFVFYRSFTLWRTDRSDARYVTLAMSFTLSGALFAILAMVGAIPLGLTVMDVGQYFVLANCMAMHRALAVLREARAVADAGNATKSRFLSTVSHELRTPLNGILGMAQVLLQPGLGEAKRDQYLRVIVNSGQTLLRLLNSLLDLSKIEAGKITLDVEAFDALRIVEDTRALFAASAEGKGLRLVAGGSVTSGQHFLGDHHRLRQMISNLVGNAIKFTATGEVRIEACELERDASGVLLEFSVSDTGIGIPNEKQALLFQPFSQADSSTSRRFGGTGLGLSIVRQLAVLMGGAAGVDSEDGQGARFWIRVRVTPVTGDIDTRAEEGPVDTPGSVEVAKAHRILVVDDTDFNRHVAEAMLDRLGYADVAFLEDGQQAVDAIVQGDPAALILMDIQMPVLDGYQATARIRQWQREHGRSGPIIIALTGDAYEEDRKRCMAAGMDGFLAKPIVMKTLADMLADLLGRQPSAAVEAAQALMRDGGLVARPPESCAILP